MFEEFMGTKEVSERHRFDTSALDAYLRQHVEGYPQGELKVEQFKGGQSNPTFKLSIGGQHYVLRTKPAPAAKLLPSAHAIEREFRVMDALHKAGFPAARQYCLCMDEDVIGRAFYVMQFVEGRVLWDQSLPGMTPTERAAIYDELNRVIAQLHTIDYNAIGLGDYGKPGNYFQRQIERWTRQYKASETETIEPMDQLIAWLPANIPPGEDTAIVHGDYRLDNMIFHATEPRVVAVLDWELGTLGEPLADFTYVLMNWINGTISTIPDLKAHGIPTIDEAVEYYCSLTGRSGLHDLNWFFAYNAFRLVGILQGILGRVRDGTANHPDAANMAPRVTSLAEMSWAYAQKAGAS